MAIEKSKVLKAAERFLASGKTAQAIDEYLKILKENPKDWNLMIQLGDLYLRQSKPVEAVEYFQKVADHYYEDGFFLKAIAIYKRINKLDPSLTDICMKLADLYLKQGLTMDAKSQLQIVAQHYLSKNQNKEAIQTLNKLIEIEPDNLRTRNELAKAYKAEGLIPEAIKEYLEISEELLRKNLTKESQAVLETAYKLDTKNADLLRKIMMFYASQNEAEKATQLLEETVSQDPTNIDLLALLAESYSERNQFQRALETVDAAIRSSNKKEPLWILKGDIFLRSGDLQRAFGQYSLVVDKYIQRKEFDKAVDLLQRVLSADPTFDSAYLKLIDIHSLSRQQSQMLAAYNGLIDVYIGKGQYQDAARQLEQLIRLDPDDIQHQEKLKFVRSYISSPESAQPATEYEMEHEMPSGGDEINVGMSLSSDAGAAAYANQPAPAPIPARALQSNPAINPVASTTVRVDEEKEFVTEHLIEAEVFNKYGLIDKAIEQLLVITNRFPDTLVAHQKLKEIFLERGDRDRAVDECVMMSVIFRKQREVDQAEDLLSEARRINPNHPALETAFQEAQAEPAVEKDIIEIEIEAFESSVQESHVEQKKDAVSLTSPTQKVAPPVVPKEDAPKPKQPAKTSSAKIGTKSGRALSPEKLLKQIQKSAAKESTKQRKPRAMDELEKLAKTIKSKSGSFKSPVSSGTSKAASGAGPKPPAPPAAPAAKPLENEAVQQEEIIVEVEEAAGPKPMRGFGGLSSDAFEEIDFYMEQGLHEDAKNLLEQMRDLHPSDSGIITRLDAVRAAIAATPKRTEERIKIDRNLQEELPPLEVGLASDNLQQNAGTDAMSEVESALKGSDVSLAPESKDAATPLAEETPPEIASFVDQPQIPQATDSGMEQTWDLGDLSQKDLDAADVEPSTPDTGAVSTEAVEEEDGLSLEESFNHAFDRAFSSPAQNAEPVDADEQQQIEVKTEDLFSEEEDFFDLAAELEEGLLNAQGQVEDDRPPDGQTYSFEEILSDFKKGVDKQLSTEDFDTRYNLGIAYKEMGLIDEAIAEFQFAAKDPKRFLECCSMLGLCFMEKGMQKLAVKWYQRGLETSGYAEEEYQGLRYDLALAYHSMGDTDRALEIFQEVYGINANYRNVTRKIKELQEQMKKQ